MKYGLVNTEKLYFSSKEAAETLGISVKDLHKLESKSQELNPKINANGKRIYKQSDIEIAKKIVDAGTNLVVVNPGVCPPVKNKPKKSKNIRSEHSSLSVAEGSQGEASEGLEKDVLLQVRNKLKNTLEHLRGK